MKNFSFLLFTVFSVSVIVTFSCKKKEIDSEVQSIIDHSLCEQEFMKIQLTVNSRATKAAGIGTATSTGGTCPKDSIAGDTTGFSSGNYSNLNSLPSLLLDWGAGCVDQADQITRAGKIKTDFSKPITQNGSVITITPMNYTVNGLTYSGVIKTTKNSLTSFTTEVSKGKCSNGAWTIDWSSTRTITWISGYGDADETNDVIQITGNSSGINREGRAFTVNITSPIIKAANCKWITKGVLEITPEGFKTRTVDFGNGACDSEATFSVNGNTYAFNMQ